MFSLAQSFDAAVGRQAERHTMTVAKAEEPDTSYTEVFDPDFKCYYKVPTICITHVPHTRLNITRLVLCRNYKIGDPSSCTMGQMCKFVHADCDYGTLPSHSVHVNYVWRDESACIYQRLPPGRCFAVHTPGLHDTVEEIASDVLLQTAAFTLVTAPTGAMETKTSVKLEEKGHVNSNNNDLKSHAENNSGGNKDTLVNGTEDGNTSNVCDVRVSESVTTLYHCADFCMNRMCKAGAECRFVHALYIDPTVQLDFRRAPSRVFVGVEVESKKGNKKKIVLEIPDGGGGTMSGNALTTTTSSTESTTLSIMPGRPPRLITTTVTTNSSNSNNNTHHNNVTELSRCSTQSSFSHRGRYVDSTSGNSGGNGVGYVLRRKLSSPSHVEMSSMSAQQVSSTLTRSSHNVSPSHPALSRHASSVMTSLSNTLTGATVNTTPTHNPHSPISSELYGKAAMMPNTTFMPTAFVTQQQQPQQHPHVLQPYPTQQQSQQYITQQQPQQQPQGATSCYFSPSPMYPFVQVMPCTTTTTTTQQQQVNMLAPAPQQPQQQPSFHHHQPQPQIPHHHHHMMQAQVQLAQPQYVQTSHTIASAQPMYLSGPFPAPMSYVTHDANRPYMTTTNAHTPAPLTTATTTTVLSPPIMYATNTNTATPQQMHSAVMPQNYLTQPMPVHTIQQQQQQQPQQQQPLRQPSSYPSNSPTSIGSLPTNTAPVMMMPQNSNSNNQQNTMNSGGNAPTTTTVYYDPAVQGNTQDEKDAVSSSAGPSREIYAGAPSTTVTSSGVSNSSLCTYGMYNAAQGQALQPVAVQHTAGGQQKVQQGGGMMPYGPRTNASSLASTPTPSTTHALPPVQSRALEVEETTQSQQQEQAEANQQQSMINCPEMPCFVLPNEGPLRPHSTLTESYGSYQATMPAPPQSVSQTRPGTTEPQPLSQVQQQRDEQESQMQSDEVQHDAHDSQGAAMSNMKKARQTRRETYRDGAQDKPDTISQGAHTNTHTVSTSHDAPRQSSQAAATTATAMTPPRSGAGPAQMHSASPHSPTQQQLQTLQQQQSLTNLNFNTSCISSQPFMMSSTSSASHPFGFTQPFGSQSLHSPAAAAGQTMGIGGNAGQSNFKGSTSGTAGRHVRRHASANYYPTQGELYGEHPGCAGAMHPRTVSKGSVGAGEQRRPQSHLTQRTQDNIEDVNCVQAEGRDGYVEPTAGQNQSAYGNSNVDVSEMYDEDREAGDNASATAAAEEQCYGNTPGMMMTTMYDEPNTSYGDAPMRSHHHRRCRRHYAGKSTQHSSPSPSSSTTARTPSRRTSHHHPCYNNNDSTTANTNTLATGAMMMYANTSRGSFHAASNQPSAEVINEGRGGTTNAMMMPVMNANESWATTSLTQACPMGLDNNGNNGCTCMQGGDSFMDSTTMPMYDYNESVCSIPPELPNWSQRPSLSVSQQQQQQQASSLVDRTNNITTAGVTLGQEEKEQRLGGGTMRMSMSARPAQDNQIGNTSISEATLQRPTPTSRRQRRLSPPRFAASCTVLESNIRHSLTRPYLTSAHSRLPSQHEQHQHNHSYAAFSQTRQGLGGAQSTELREARASLTGNPVSGGSGRRVVLHRDEHSASLRPPEMETLYGGSNTNNNNNIANSSCTSHTGITPCIYTPKAYSPEDVPLVQPQYSAQEESSATVMSMNYREMISPMERPMNAKNMAGGEQREMNRSSHELLSPARYSPKASSMTYHPSEASHHFRYEGNTYNNNSSHESTPSRDYYNRSACCVDLRRVQGQPDKARGYGERLQITQSIRSAPVSMTTLPEISAAALGNRLRYRNDPYSAATRVIVSTEQCE